MKLKELLLRRTMPIVINSYNQRFYLKNMINKLLSFNFKNIYIIDNNSNSLALINYYQELASNPFVTVIYYGANLGPRSFHLNGCSDIFGNLPHIYSDPDLDFDFMSDCYLEYLLNLSHKYKICKVGSALEIPDETIGKKDLKLKINGKEYSVKEWESQFWINEIEKDIYLAPIDTTFHLFNPQYYQSGEPYVTGIRVGAVGFVAKHLPWYESNNSEEIEEMLIYKKTQTGWNNY